MNVMRVMRWAPVAALLTLACGDPTAPAFPTEAAPSAFHISYAGWIYGSHTVELQGDTLVITRAPDFRPDSVRVTKVVPTAADWRAFWRAADAAGVRSWPSECIDRDIVDGGGLDMRIEYGAGHVATTTSNSYPHRNGRCGDTSDGDEYHTLLTAVAVLIGRPFP